MMPVTPSAEEARWAMINHRLGALGILTNDPGINAQVRAPDLSPHQWERLLAMAAR